MRQYTSFGRKFEIYSINEFIFKLESKRHGFLKYLNQVSKLLRKEDPVSEGQADSWCSGRTTLGVCWSEAGAA